MTLRERIRRSATLVDDDPITLVVVLDRQVGQEGDCTATVRP